ncbi:hypothetical protein [Corynebacterium suedekumii]|uniref:Histone n=1 Tax=Corynebacterium suedekumii TaxID=3049801 RepID=A0ABY8VLR1_9CORY|nr:hypothetical protein [Corynebacterium suedekumii]WIM70571.1 hypothetical protein QP029_01620 [Corynebacterium suedekumii]
MPPKVTDTRPTPEALHAVEAETAAAARRIVATYAEDFLDGVTLMCMLGVEPEGLVYKKVAAEAEEAAPKATKRTRKAAKKATKKTTKKTAKKTTKKATKKATKKTTAKKTTKKA